MKKSKSKNRLANRTAARVQAIQNRKGFLLLVVLLVVSAISLGALSYSRSMMTGREEAAIAGEAIQARYAADSGIDAARLFLAYPRDQRTESGGTYSNPNMFQAVSVLQGRGQTNVCNYSLVAPDLNEDGKYASVRFGLHNESAKLNINVLPIIDSQFSLAQVLQQVAGPDLSSLGLGGGQPSGGGGGGGGQSGSGGARPSAGGGQPSMAPMAGGGQAVVGQALGGQTGGGIGAARSGGSSLGAAGGSSSGASGGAASGGVAGALGGAGNGNIARLLLMALPSMTEDIADAILDFVDTDDTAREYGAEGDYYAALDPPYAPVNGPLQSIEQLLLVRGVTPQLLFGYDQNRNGVLDPAEETAAMTAGSSESSADASAESDIPELGWAVYLTIYSKEKNVQADGSPKININGTDMATLQPDLETAVGADLATFIVAYRYLANAQQQGAAGAGAGAGGGGQGGPGGGQGGGRDGGGRDGGGRDGGGRDGGGRDGGGPGGGGGRDGGGPGGGRGPGGGGGPGGGFGPGGPGGPGGGGPGGGGPGGGGPGGGGGGGRGPGGGRGGRSSFVWEALPLVATQPAMLVSFLQQGGGRGPMQNAGGQAGGGQGGGRGPGNTGPGNMGPGGQGGGRGPGGDGGGRPGGDGGGRGPGRDGGGGGRDGGPGGGGGRDGGGRDGGGRGNGGGGPGMGGGGMPGISQSGAAQTKTQKWNAGLFDSLGIDTSQPPSGSVRQVLDLIDAQFTAQVNGEQVVFKSPLEPSPIAMAIYLPTIMEKLTAVTATTLPGRININEAPREILQGLPGITEDILEQLIEARAQSADNQNRKYETWPMVEGILTLQQMRTISPLITGGGDVMRAHSVGYFEQSAGSSRVEAVIDASGSVPIVVMYRKLDHLGRGFSQSTLGQRAQGLVSQ